MARDIFIIPNRGTTTSGQYPEIQFNGASVSTISLKVDDDGSVKYTGDNGTLFNITDSKEGLLHSVSDISGLPILQVWSDDRVIMGRWDKNALVVNYDKVGIGLTAPSVKLHVYGTSSGIFRLQDGSQASGYILVSDSNGVASWTASSNVVPQSLTPSLSAVLSAGTSSGNNHIQMEAGKNIIFKEGGENNYRTTLTGDNILTNNNTVYLPIRSGRITFQDEDITLSNNYILKGTSNGGVTSSTKLYDNGTYVSIGTASGLSNAFTVWSPTNGAIRIVDGTQGEGKVLTSDANGVGTWQTASPTIGATNGLSLIENNIELGGTLSHDTYINNIPPEAGPFIYGTKISNELGTTFEYNEGDVYKIISTGEIINSNDYSLVGTYSALKSGGESSNPISIQSVGNSGIAWFNRVTIDRNGIDIIRGSSSTIQSIEIDSSDMKIIDNLYNKGLVYAGDYSNNFVTYSLVTKGWVTSQIAGNGGTVSGTTNKIAKFTGTNILGDSSIQDNGTTISFSVGMTSSNDIEISDNTKGVILKSPNGTRWRITIDNTGALTSTSL